MSNEENNVEEVVESKPVSVIQFIENNSKNLMYAGVGLLVLALGFWYYTSKHLPKKEATANDEFYKAENLFAQDSIDLALNGGSDFLGLVDVAAEYKNTSAGEKASYLAARGFMQKGQYDEALSYLDNVSFEDQIVAPLAICLKGDCKVELDDVEGGAALYEKAAKLRDNSFTAPYCYTKAAKAYAYIGDWESSLKMLEVIKKDYSETQFASDIDKEIARAKAAISSTNS